MAGQFQLYLKELPMPPDPGSPKTAEELANAVSMLVNYLGQLVTVLEANNKALQFWSNDIVE